MATLEIHHIPVLGDHDIWLVREPDSGDRAVVDPAVAGPVQSKLKELGWELTHILDTHHHNDHTGGNLELKEAWGLTVVGPRADNDAMKEAVGLAGAGVVSVFAEIRRRKDHFRGTRVGRT